ncbi:MAG: Flp family type IVb pilin, partial [Desulfuromonadales bacterium]|nr:Flp family type IVb pilin [Desulfuromonadales bacterium]NIS43553.1 Flp family type IVb pilin [Desulfuromonadales bacterium]
MRQSCSDFWADERGLAVIEYGLILGFISFAIISLLSSMGDSVNTAFTDVNSGLET